MIKINFHNRGQSLVWIIIVLIIVGLITGGLYYYLQKQISEAPEITEKPIEEEIVNPEEEVVVPPLEEELPKKEAIPEEKIKERPVFSPGEVAPLKPIVRKCVDGTLYGQCSTNKPKYCDSGNLINNCQGCGCPTNELCRVNGDCLQIIDSKVLNVGVVIFKYSDTILPDFLYCRWPNGDRWFYLNACRDINRPGQKAEILSRHATLDLLTDSINTKRAFPFGLGNHYVYSLYFLSDYLKNQAANYGVDFKMNLSLQGVFNLTKPLPPTTVRVGGGGYLLTHYDFFKEQAKEKMNLESFDKSIIIFLNDADLQSREKSFSFASVALIPNVAVLNFRIGADLIHSDDFMIVLSHEFQHLLGASDLYLEPCPRGHFWACCLDPEGIPEPNKIPRYPQTKACSMCQFITLKPDGESKGASLEEVVICPRTAEEMGWK